MTIQWEFPDDDVIDDVIDEIRTDFPSQPVRSPVRMRSSILDFHFNWFLDPPIASSVASLRASNERDDWSQLLARQPMAASTSGTVVTRSIIDGDKS